jgi:hypothetical protein
MGRSIRCVVLGSSTFPLPYMIRILVMGWNEEAKEETIANATQLYAQNLSLFAKLFLDTKSVFYDVTTFLYYLLVAHDPVPAIPNTNLADPPVLPNIIQQLEAAAAGIDSSAHVDAEQGAVSAGQVVGFFSKEKMSWDNNNLACILVFPPWQKQGLGQVLMGASYEMSKREGRLGGPEKRMSALSTYLHTPHTTSQAQLDAVY